MSLIIPATPLYNLWPLATIALKDGVCSSSKTVLSQYGIVTLVDLIDFLATISEETNGGEVLVENLNYSAQRLTEVWPSRFPDLASAAPFAYSPQALANNVYGGRYGNTGPNDGWLFRGQGLMQLTFKGNASALTNVTGLDLVNHPELATDPLHALEVAAAFWKQAGVSALADFEAKTIRVNGGKINYSARLVWRARWAANLTAANTNNVPAGRPAATTGGDVGPDPVVVAPKETTMPGPTPKPPTPAPPPAPIVITPAVIAAIPLPPVPAQPAVPTISQSVSVDWGSWCAQILLHESAAIETVAEAGVGVLLASIPFGQLISAFVGPKIISGYVQQAVRTLSALLDAQAPIVADNWLETFVFSSLNTYEPQLASMLGTQLVPMITVEIQKLLATSTAAKTA